MIAPKARPLGVLWGPHPAQEALRKSSYLSKASSPLLASASVNGSQNIVRRALDATMYRQLIL